MKPLKFASGMTLACALGATCMAATPAFSQTRAAPVVAAPSYADIADLADSARLVVKASPRGLVRVPNNRATGLRPGWGRYLVKARTRALLTGTAPLGESLAYLVDLPLDARGKPPAIKKRDVLLFARSVPGRPAELQLVAPDAQLIWDAALESRVRTILIDLVAPGAPGRVLGVREMIHVPGALAGEGDTQIFLSTDDESPASITVEHRPGRQPRWGASFTELLAEAGNQPVRDTLVWYRLACFLPPMPPRGANLSDSAASRARAEADYRMVVGALGECPRNRK